MAELAAYAEIHVVSDLHMGGDRPAFQIFKETDRLAAYIRWLKGHREGEAVALVLNGDVIDTLAEDGVQGYVATGEAVATLDRIIGDPSFSPVWEALCDFVHAPSRTLVILIGNHDIEMAFPAVQRRVLERLAGDDLEARARVEFSTIGAGYSCTVGSARVFCTHGNEVDPWNLNRYDDLARAARRLGCARPLPPQEWHANAGTRMVKDVMNQVKRRYAWIDLLKPETSAALGALIALDPAQLGKLSELPGILLEKERGAAEMDRRLEVAAAAPGAPAEGADLEVLLGPAVRADLDAGAATGMRGDDLLLELETGKAGARQGAYGDAPLGARALLWDKITGWITGVGPDEALRKALQDWLGGDRSFDLDNRDDTFAKLTGQAGGTVDFVVTGHTHLERAIPLGGHRHYFNCGTWVRLIRLTDAMLSSRASFKPVYDILCDGSMAAIDGASARLGQPLVLDRTSAVSIGLENGRTVGRLRHVINGPAGMFDPGFERPGNTVLTGP